MIVAQQMKDPMRQQQIQHGVKWALVLDGHGVGRWCGDHHITQQVRAHLTVVPVVHGKGQHIGWPLHPAVVLVETSDPGIVDYRNTELCLSVTQGA